MTLRQLGGRLLYQVYYAPIEKLNAIRQAGGFREARRTEKGRREMEAAAAQLPALPGFTGAPLELHLLTGRRFWYQSAFCLYSFSTHAARPVRPVFYDDGTLAITQRRQLQRLFPEARFVSKPEALEKLDRLLPRARYPVLRERWDNYPNLRKLIDPHVGAVGYRLVIDSDLLFFRRPQCLMDWCDRPSASLHAVDSEQSYGYSPSLLRTLARGPLAERLNVGLCGLRSDELDWDWLEHASQRLIAAEGTHYYFEQALVALWLAGQTCTVAPENEYITLPRGSELFRRQAVMHHYVANSKRWYFQHNWRVCVPGIQPRSNPQAPLAPQR
jgi:hypothetical protein